MRFKKKQGNGTHWIQGTETVWSVSRNRLNKQPYAREYAGAKGIRLRPLFQVEKLQSYSLCLIHADLLIAIKDTGVSLIFLTQTLGNGSNRHSNEKGHPKNPIDLLQLDTTAPFQSLGVGLDEF